MTKLTSFFKALGRPLVGGLLPLLVAVAAQAGPVRSPADVLDLVRAHGASAAVQVLWESEADWSTVLEGIATGSPDWLEAAKVLRPGADAGASEELEDALYEALVNQPYKALPFVQRDWRNSRQQLCYFEYDSELPGGVRSYAARLQLALRAPAPKSMARLRQDCLLGLAKTRRKLAAVSRDSRAGR